MHVMIYFRQLGFTHTNVRMHTYVFVLNVQQIFGLPDKFNGMLCHGYQSWWDSDSAGSGYIISRH